MLTELHVDHVFMKNMLLKLIMCWAFYNLKQFLNTSRLELTFARFVSGDIGSFVVI